MLILDWTSYVQYVCVGEKIPHVLGMQYILLYV